MIKIKGGDFHYWWEGTFVGRSANTFVEREWSAEECIKTPLIREGYGGIFSFLLEYYRAVRRIYKWLELHPELKTEFEASRSRSEPKGGPQ